jgi:Rho family protein
MTLTPRPTDLRPPEPNAPGFVSRAQGERVAAQIGARAYKECSALSASGVDDVFEAATRASMLMREGVPAHARADSAPAHARRDSAAVAAAGVDEGAGKCCVVC